MRGDDMEWEQLVTKGVTTLQIAVVMLSHCRSVHLLDPGMRSVPLRRTLRISCLS